MFEILSHCAKAVLNEAGPERMVVFLCHLRFLKSLYSSTPMPQGSARRRRTSWERVHHHQQLYSNQATSGTKGSEMEKNYTTDHSGLYGGSLLPADQASGMPIKILKGVAREVWIMIFFIFQRPRTKITTIGSSTHPSRVGTRFFVANHARHGRYIPDLVYLQLNLSRWQKCAAEPCLMGT
ncbi:hypothetical protein EJ02DRAFT_181784 [Clathrospora elynae]|uniref:Uncharacterized protein n=1 Tax=Clathrospora elynae TaxID=706981 RepID=A0A6A5SR98_9PLEO|nr:hypothetical protein EJ02DRAFT_181784 [Clathrospora elynae]